MSSQQRSKTRICVISSGHLGLAVKARILADQIKEAGMEVVVVNHDDGFLTEEVPGIHQFRLPRLCDHYVEEIPKDKRPYWRQFQKKARR